MADAILARNITKRFKNTTAVNKASLAVGEGEVFGLVGPDGAGKTTLIRILATILLASEGDAFVGGFSVTHEPQKVRTLIGYMSQRFNLYSDLTVLENLNFFADLYQMPEEKRQTRIQNLLAFSNLTDCKDRPSAQLSGGMKQKLALACTLIHEPKILILDEPTTGVDPVSRREFWKILSRLHQLGVTILITTPYMDEAERCQKVAFINNGGIVLCDSPANIKARIPGKVLAIETSDTQRAFDLIKARSEAKQVEIFGSIVRVIIDDPNRDGSQLHSYLERSGIKVNSIKVVDLSMENAFVYIANSQKGGANAK